MIASRLLDVAGHVMAQRTSARPIRFQAAAECSASRSLPTCLGASPEQHPIQAVPPTASGGEVEEDEAVERRQLALVEDREEAAGRMYEEVRHRQLTGEHE